MEQLKITPGVGPFIYLVVFDCPVCGHCVVARGRESTAHSEEQMREKAFRVRCSREDCAFDGLVRGTHMRSVIELDFTDWRPTSASAAHG